MRKSVLILVLVVALTGGSVSCASQSSDMPEEARAALYNAWGQIEIDNPRISFSFRDNAGSPFNFRFYVLYNGVRISGVFLVIRTNHQGDVTRVSLSDIGNISLNTRPTISRGRAEAIARAELGNEFGDRLVLLLFHEAELVIELPYHDYDVSRLIWVLRSDSAALFAYVDAHSGEFLGYDSTLI